MYMFLISFYIVSFILLGITLPFWALALSCLDGFGSVVGVSFVIFYSPIILPLALIVYINEKLFPTPKEEDIRKIAQQDFDNSEIGKHFKRIRKTA